MAQAPITRLLVVAPLAQGEWRMPKPLKPETAGDVRYRIDGYQIIIAGRKEGAWFMINASETAIQRCEVNYIVSINGMTASHPDGVMIGFTRPDQALAWALRTCSAGNGPPANPKIKGEYLYDEPRHHRAFNLYG